MDYQLENGFQKKHALFEQKNLHKNYLECFRKMIEIQALILSCKEGTKKGVTLEEMGWMNSSIDKFLNSLIP